MNCQKFRCTNVATKKPRITFAATADGPRAAMEIGVYVYNEHAVKNPEAFVSDIGWWQIRREMHHKGLAKPDRDALQVEFIEVQ